MHEPTTTTKTFTTDTASPQLAKDDSRHNQRSRRFLQMLFGPGHTIRDPNSRRNKRRLGKAFRQAQRIERITAAAEARKAAAAA